MRRPVALVAVTLVAVALGAQTAAPPRAVAPQAEHGPRLLIAVTDENGAPVAGAQIVASNGAALPGASRTWRGESDDAGRLTLLGAEPGSYHVSVERAGFYPFITDVTLAAGQTLEIALLHHQPVGEVVNVIDVAPSVDPQQTAKSETLLSRDIINIPYSTTRDVRNVFTYIPGVVQDQASGQVHIAGGTSYQTAYVLDGFRINQPAGGTMELRLNPEAVRTIDVESSRYSAQFGRASSGVLQLDTRTGDDSFRFAIVNFVPTLQFVKGLHINNVTPRGTFSGPLKRKRAWFYLAQDGEYDNVIIQEQPAGADQAAQWRAGSLGKVQVNLTPGNVLTGSFVYNTLDAPNAFLSRFTPKAATVNLDSTVWLLSVRDQAYLSKSTLLDVGIAVSDFRDAERPQGQAFYEIHTDSVAGNYYRTQLSHSGRAQGVANLFLPPWQWHGTHELRVGVDVDAVDSRVHAHRNPTLVFREDSTLSRRIQFTDFPHFNKDNIATGLYAQDRWSHGQRLLLEIGARLDRDQIVRDFLFSPRFAASYLIGSVEHGTKISAGAGLFYDETRLSFITLPLAGARTDFFFGPDGLTQILPPALTSFRVDPSAVRDPRFLNWSLGAERMLPAGIYGKLDFVERRGARGFTYVNTAADAGSPGGDFLLTNTRRDHYDAVQFTLRRDFSNNHAVLFSYTRSATRTNRALEFTLDNPIFGQQAPGPLPWDVPDRVVTWGWLPFPLLPKTDFAYSLEWRTGFAFNLVNERQQLVGLPDRTRFPQYLTLNPALEHRFFFVGYEWAVRVGIENITGSRNPTLVNNNVDSPQFLTLGGLRHRTFNGRIRFLGKK